MTATNGSKAWLTALIASTLPTAIPSVAQVSAAPGHDAALLVDQVTVAGTRRLIVSSPGFAQGGEIDVASTQYGANAFPGLRWDGGPEATRSFVVVVQGVLDGTPSGGTSVHLVVYDLAASTRSLAAGMTQPPGSGRLGTNVHGPASTWAGPHPHGSGRQAYHAQVFALDRTLGPDDAGSIAALARGMRGHVLAAGDLVGYASRPEDGTSSSESPVRVETGLLSGVRGRDPSVMVFRGVPYAAAPVGRLRWRPPAPPAAWSGVRSADRFGPACPQPGGQMAKGLAQSEDCLTLNVWTGGRAVGREKRPVFVWIYGGGFIGGTGASPEFDGEALAKKGLVVVTFNYRVGVLGFLATPELSRESGHGASGNYGILDDVAALRWVQRNIAAFGGDPTKVTIGGQSAGAGSVGFLAMSPLAKGLFRAGILESHARYPRDTELRYLSVSWRPLAGAEAAGTAYARAHGAGTLAELRAMPWQKLIVGSDTIDRTVETGSEGKPPLFRPVVDGWVIPRDYDETFAARSQNDVAIVAGNNKDETGAVPETAFAALRARTAPPRAGMPQTSVTLAAYQANARRRFGSLADEFLRLYPAHDDEQAALQNNAAARDNSRISTWLWGTLWTQGSDRPVYTYWWTHAPPGPDHDARGAYHGSEIPYVFDSLDVVDRPWSADDRRIADVMSSYWANIVANGEPNGSGLPVWPRYDPRTPRVMTLGDAFAPIPVATPEHIAFWRRFYATQPAW